MPQIQEENWLYPSRLAGLRKTETESFSQIVKQSILEFLPLVILYLVREGTAVQRKVALLALMVYGLPAALAVLMALIGLPFAFLTSVSSVTCGWTLPFAGPYLHLVAESCPPGTWQVTQFEGPREQKSLFHSEAHQSREVWSFMARWIKNQSKAFGVGAGAS
jgi:hypothetical protein